MSRVYTDRVFDCTDIIALNHLYENCEPEYIKQLHNLFYVERRTPRSADAQYFYDKLESYTGRKIRNFYFLNYTEGAFARRHSDDNTQAGLTAITMMHRSNDLIGGETVVYLPYEDRPVHHHVNRGKEFRVGSEFVPSLVSLNVGETSFYDTEVQHEVTLVHAGTRRVLVTWFHPEVKND